MDEAPVVVTAATGALGPVVEKLGTLRRWRGEYQLRRRTRKDVKRIRSRLKSIHSILWVIWEGEDLDAEGKEPRMEAWRLADEMDDAIDDFILSLKRSSDGRRFIQAKHQASPFKDLKTRADDVWKRCHNKWKTETSSHTTVSSLFSRKKTTVGDSGPGKWPHRVVDPYVHKDISKLFEMEEPRDKFIKHLVGEEDSTPQAQLKMASILGAAGKGKTTLARLVYEEIEDKFDARAFVSITSCHNMTEVLESIYQQLVQGLPDSSSVVPLAGTKAATAEEHLIDAISNFLKKKRYLVIIEDIWHWGEWETIKKSLPDNNQCSRIVTTSRVNAITDKLSDDFNAPCHVICHMTFRETMSLLGYLDVGKGFDRDHPIVQMCDGMPLAVVCVVSAVAKERERREQQGLCVLRPRALQDEILKQVMGNGIQKTHGFEPLVESLELGYKVLPHHMLKTCLLYCSIYPEHHYIRRDDSVSRWIAEGFVRKEEAAKDYFDELVSKDLLFGQFQKGNETYYLHHPMMRNYLRRKLGEDNFITCPSDSDVPSSPVGRLCIDYRPCSDAVEQKDPLPGMDLHHIRSLVVFGDVERVPYKRLQRLRVLDAHGDHGALDDMCELLRLRHLLVSGAERINEIPADIARLQYLETLHVTSTNIKRLPAEIGDLRQLKTLCIRDSKIIEQAWEIIGTLEKLKTLDVSDNPELSGIPKDICELQQLKHLNVSNNPGITELPREIGKLQHLEMLDLYRTSIAELPREIGNLQRLVYLDLSSTKITKVPQDIVKLQRLESLIFWGTDVGKMPREIWGLQNLKYLKGELGILRLEAGQLSKLEGLPNCVREAWKNSHTVSSLAGEIITGGGDDYGGLVNHTKHMWTPRWIKEHFNNIPSLDIRMCKLEEQHLKILQEMPNLHKLTLRFEGVPRKPIVISSGGFEKLQQFVVDSRVPRVTFQEGAMPRLWYLEFEFQFYGGPPNKDPMGIKHLVSLKYVTFRCNEWYRGDSPCISATIDVMRKEATEHPNLIRLTVPGKDMYESFPGIEEISEDGSEACSFRDEITLEVPGKDMYKTFPGIEEISEDGSEACSGSGAEDIKEIEA